MGIFFSLFFCSPSFLDAYRYLKMRMVDLCEGHPNICLATSDQVNIFILFLHVVEGSSVLRKILKSPKARKNL